MQRWNRIACCAVALAGIALAAQAEQIKIYITSGTGFFVNNDGYILTNNHVVQNCKKISVDGAITTRDVTLAYTDTTDDLALLKTDSPVFESADFRDSRRPIVTGDRAVIVGYPGNAYKTGAPVTREASIVSPIGPNNEVRWVRLSDAVQPGNSGGPLFDSTGNVIGVVTAKAVIYTYHTDDPKNGVTSDEGIAIAIPTVEGFLDHAGVRYRTSMSESMLSADSITEHARRMIVNVRCEYKTEEVR